MPKYEFDAVRWLRNVAEIQSHRAGAGPAMLRENMLKCAVEIERLRMADDLHQQGAEHMREESASLSARVSRLEEALKEISTLYWIDAPAPEEMRRIARRALEEK